jgi:hypothetical protein
MRTIMVNLIILLFLFGGIEIMKKFNARDCVKDFSVLFHRTTLEKANNTNKKHRGEDASLKKLKKMTCD